MSDEKRRALFLITHHSSLITSTRPPLFESASKRGKLNDETVTLLLSPSLPDRPGGRAELAAVPRRGRLGRRRRPEDAGQLGRGQVRERRLEDADSGALAREPGRL